MVKRRGKKACLIYDLPLSLVDDILAHVVWPFDAHALTLVSKAFYRSAMPVLYERIAITHDRPAATLEMLNMLSCRPDVAAFVHVLVLDDAVSPLYGPSVNRSQLAEALDRLRTSRTRRLYPDLLRPWMPRFPVPPKELRIAMILLRQIIPALPNLQEICLRSVHPYLIAECDWSTYPRRRERWMHKVKTSLRLNSQPLHETGPRHYYSFHTPHRRTPDWDFWQAVTQHPQRDSLRRLSVVLLDKSCLATSRPFSSLHVLHLAVKSSAGYVSDSWVAFLGELKRIHTLCITGYGFGRRLDWAHGSLERILQCFDFAGLRTLQICKVTLSGLDYLALQSFIASQADTLEVLALCFLTSRTAHAGIPIIPLPILTASPDTGAELSFAQLHTLRLSGVEQVDCFGCMFRAVGAPHQHPHQHRIVLSDAAERAHAELTRFVVRHPGITDLALCGLHDASALAAIERACAARPMRRMLVGAAFDAEMQRHCERERGTAWRVAVERWMHYDVMFKDLELERPEYGSTLAGLPRSRLAQRHGH